ncbi:MAG: hypothetical protein U0103_29145, partial [Candidatus Obscuribacterales bacterium]
MSSSNLNVVSVISCGTGLFSIVVSIFFTAVPLTIAQTANSRDSLTAVSSSNSPGVLSGELKAAPQSELESNLATKRASLNPIRWLLGPVIKLEEQTVRLQRQIVNLTAPLNAVQPLLSDLHEQVASTEKRITAVNSHL